MFGQLQPHLSSLRAFGYQISLGFTFRVNNSFDSIQDAMEAARSIELCRMNRSTIPKMIYDSVNGVVLCVAWLDKGGHETWALDVGKMAWTKMDASIG
jgi:hypothetical protein